MFLRRRRFKRGTINALHDHAVQLSDRDPWHQFEAVGIVSVHLLLLLATGHDGLEDRVRVRGSEVRHALPLLVGRQTLESDPVAGGLELAAGPEPQRVTHVDQDATGDVWRPGPGFPVG